jgi:hypothetical protein
VPTNYACAQFLILQNFYGFNVIIALKYVSYAVLLGIEEEITSEPEPGRQVQLIWTT